MPSMWVTVRIVFLLGAALLAGCAGVPAASLRSADGWHPVPLPGKRSTSYEPTTKGGRAAIVAVAKASASMWRRKVDIAPGRLGDVTLSWWVDDLIASANMAEADLADAPARVLFAFGGDPMRLTARTRTVFELAQALTGEAPPFATLMYVWENEAAVGSVIINPRTDRIRKIVLDSGPQNLGRWRDHRRNLVDDYRRAFGEDPGPLVGIAIMTDADNTQSSARAWYGPIELRP